MSEREVGHAHLTGPTSWCWSAEIFVFHLFCVFSWQPHSHWPLSRHTILFHQIEDDEKRKNTLNFTLRFPEFLQFGKVFVQDEDFGQADGRHFSPLSPPPQAPSSNQLATLDEITRHFCLLFFSLFHSAECRICRGKKNCCLWKSRRAMAVPKSSKSGHGSRSRV